jgi:precorrin-2 dehydrogenase/sirohydrochlorin ferrochelatase
MQYFPLFFDLNHKPVTVVGGGDVACRKIEPLLKCGAKITLIAPDVHPDLKALADKHQISWQQKVYDSDSIGDAVQVWATTNQSKVNRQVYQDAKQRGVMVNVVDDKPFCDFITPSMIDRSPIQIAISSGGASPVLIRNVRRNLEAVLPQNLSLLAEFAEQQRDWVKSRYDTVESRRHFWEAFFDLRAVNLATNMEQLQSALDTCHSEMQPRDSRVIAVEWGEDVELLSLKATRLMQLADIVYSTAGVPEEYIEMSRRDSDKKRYADESALLKVLNDLRNAPASEGLVHVVFVTRSLRGKIERLSSSIEYIAYASL